MTTQGCSPTLTWPVQVYPLLEWRLPSQAVHPLFIVLERPVFLFRYYRTLVQKVHLSPLFIVFERPVFLFRCYRTSAQRVHLSALFIVLERPEAVSLLCLCRTLFPVVYISAMAYRTSVQQVPIMFHARREYEGELWRTISGRGKSTRTPNGQFLFQVPKLSVAIDSNNLGRYRMHDRSLCVSSYGHGVPPHPMARPSGASSK